MPEKSKIMNPYLGGALSGLLVVASVWITGKFFGASTTFVRAAGFIENTVIPALTTRMEYYTKEAPVIDWQWMFVVGVLIGSLIASLATRSFKLQAVPDKWRERFGPSAVKRGLGAFCGGVIAIFGARLADGCPSGHGLSGVMQLSLSSVVALACFFAGGIIVSRVIYGGRRQS